MEKRNVLLIVSVKVLNHGWAVIYEFDKKNKGILQEMCIVCDFLRKYTFIKCEKCQCNN